MTQKTSLAIPEEIGTEVFAMADRGESYEAISLYMATAGLEKILAIRLLSQAAHIGLSEAKELIHFSPAWQFRRGSDDEFQTTVYTALKHGRAVSENMTAKPLKTGTG